MQKNKQYKYIECPSCKIGGYDFCPECYGGGGYSIEIEEPETSSKITINTSRIYIINKKIDIISKAELKADHLDNRLQEFYNELIDTQYTDEVITTLKRIIKLRKIRKKNILIKEIKKFCNNIQEIVIDIRGDSEFKSDEPFWRRDLLNMTEKNFVPFTNEYFSHDIDYGFVIKLTKSKWVTLSIQLFEQLFHNLFRSSVFDFESNEISFVHGFESEIKKMEFRQKLVKISAYFENSTYRFVIPKLLLRGITINYINELQIRGITEWYYIRAKNY